MLVIMNDIFYKTLILISLMISHYPHMA